MSNLYDKLCGSVGEGISSGWQWVNQLDRQEWLMLLLVTAILGFVCMRGFGSRSSY
jgi:hypothetical protein